ncbi:MAG TPA: hypothetical protein VGH11_08400 [Jatrophihabitans sp.]
MDLESVADELYGLWPEEFTARRGELATEARGLGDRELAAEIGKLRRASVAAWLINQLTRGHTDRLDELSEFAGRLRSAHQGLKGAQLRELSSQRQELLGSLTVLVADIAIAADRPATDAVLQQVRQTLEAAIADENAEAAIRSGRLTTALSYIGFGGVDLTNAVALADRRPKQTSTPRLHSVPTIPADSAADDEDLERSTQSGNAQARAEQAAAVAAENVRVADAERERAQLRQEQAEQRLNDLQARIDHARASSEDAADQLAAAQRRYDRALAHLDDAERALDAARGTPPS